MKSIMQIVIIYSLASVSWSVIIPPEPSAIIVYNHYIISLKDSVNLENFISRQVLERNDGKTSKLESRVKFVYGAAINGFAAELDDTELKTLDSLDEVSRITYDQVMSTFPTVTQQSSPYGLNRLSQNPPVSPNPPWVYTYDDCGPAPCTETVFVIDTGINVNHNEFLTSNGSAIVSRASLGPSYVPGVPTSMDDNGHGTHCAGTIAGNTYGVAKRACVVAIKILDSRGGGPISQFIAGINYVCSIVNSNSKFVISLSLGAGYDAHANQAVKNATDRGIMVVAAAGNGNSRGLGQNACNVSPSSAPSAITVGASDISDNVANFSNCGPCVDIFAPGVKILSTWIGNNTATNTLSGTSMATPHVAGLVAYFWQFTSGNLTEVVLSYANNGKIKFNYNQSAPCSQTNLIRNTPNKLARNNVNNQFLTQECIEDFEC